MFPFRVAVLVPLVTAVAFVNQNFPGLINTVKHVFGNLAEYQDHFLTLAGLVVQHPSFIFWSLFVFRYFSVVVHAISYWCFYRPTPVPTQPTILTRDCSVVLPTVDPDNNDFRNCIDSCLQNGPGEIIIVTVGRNMAALTNQAVGPFRASFPRTTIRVLFADIANKRLQIALGVSRATGKITVLLDDKAIWNPWNCLFTILAPFENDKVGAVGTNIQAYRKWTGFNIRSFWNTMGALQLAHHDFEIRATNAIDGGVSAISGRTAAYRTSILQQPGFMSAFTNEIGPLDIDNDNFLTRQVVAQGYDIKIQHGRDILVKTTLDEYPGFLSRCLNSARTTWRNNFASLFTDGTVWRRQPWSVYAVYLTSFVDFALFYDAALIYALSKIADRVAVHDLLTLIFTTKMVALIPYFLQEPQHILMLPEYFIFTYVYSFIKLYAGLTFWVRGKDRQRIDAFNPNNQAYAYIDDSDNDSDDSDPRNSSSSSLTLKPASSSSSRSSTSSSTSSYYGPPWGNPRIAPQGWTSTPWGNVQNYRNNPVRPANVLESHSTSSGTTSSRSQTSPTSVEFYTGASASTSTSTQHTPPLRTRTSIYDIDSPTPSPRSTFSFSSSSSLPTIFSISSTSSTSTPISAIRNLFTTTTPTPTQAPSHSPPNSHPITLPRERHALRIPDTYTKTWTRGKQCHCLHSDRDALFKTRSCRCLVPGVFGVGVGVGGSVVPGRPRF